jgi:broad specificity phosphatase PhoE
VSAQDLRPEKLLLRERLLPICLVGVILAFVEMAKYVELRRHTDAEGDVLTDEGVRAATRIGARLEGGYDLLVSTGAQRATQTLACFLAALGERVPGGVVVETDLRSTREERWREAYEKAGSGELEAMRSADPELVEEDAAALGAALGRLLDALTDGGRALVVGHSPTNEAAVLGLTGEIVAPISKGAGVLLVAGDQGFRVKSLD